MRALLCHRFGGFDELRIDTIDEPTPGAGEVVIDVRAAGFNFPDLLIVQGLYQTKPPFPFSPGGEASGIISEVGEGVVGLETGDRVIALSSHGAFRERWCVPARDVRKMPDAMGFDVGAALTLTYGTSWYALRDRAKLAAGESLLVMGASGGVGRAAVELGKRLGATVIAAASSAEKLEVAREAGADHLIHYGDEPLRDALKAIVGRSGVDVVYDPVGGEYSELAFRSLAWCGRHLVIGFAAGDIPKLPLNLALLKNASLVGVFWGAWTQRDPKAAAASFAELDTMVVDGKITPLVSKRFAFDDFREAFNHLAARKAVGKVVLEFGGA